MNFQRAFAKSVCAVGVWTPLWSNAARKHSLEDSLVNLFIKQWPHQAINLKVNKGLCLVSELCCFQSPLHLVPFPSRCVYAHPQTIGEIWSKNAGESCHRLASYFAGVSNSPHLVTLSWVFCDGLASHSGLGSSSTSGHFTLGILWWT